MQVETEIDGKIRGLIESDISKKSNRRCCSARGLFGIECSKKIIESHTLSKSGSLKTIMNKQNKVCGINLTFNALEKNGGYFDISEFGINKASTFKGFCSEHDKKLFSIFEDSPIIPTKEQLCMLSYRGICRELYTKENESNTGLLHNMCDFSVFSDSPILPIVKNIISKRNELLGIGLTEIKNTYHELNNIISNNRFDDLEYFVISLSYPSKVLCSGAIVPDRDFNNKILKDLSNKNEKAEHLFFNIINYEDRGMCIFSWIKKEENKYFYDFIKTLVQRKHRIEDNLVNFVFSYFENTYFSPDWWKGLTEEKKNEIQRKIMEYDGCHNLAEHKIKNYLAFKIDKYNYLK